MKKNKPIVKTPRCKRNSFVKSETRGVRAHCDWWDMVAEVSKVEGTTRNELIIRAVTIYCEGK